jgi:hypothetical protein
MTTEDLHGYEKRSAPPALPPLICMVISDHSSFSVLRETHMTFACVHFKQLKCYESETQRRIENGQNKATGLIPTLENRSLVCQSMELSQGSEEGFSSTQAGQDS